MCPHLSASPGDSRPRRASCEGASAPQVGGPASRPPSSLAARSLSLAPRRSPPFSPPSPVTQAHPPPGPPSPGPLPSRCPTRTRLGEGEWVLGGGAGEGAARRRHLRGGAGQPGVDGAGRGGHSARSPSWGREGPPAPRGPRASPPPQSSARGPPGPHPELGAAPSPRSLRHPGPSTCQRGSLGVGTDRQAWPDAGRWPGDLREPLGGGDGSGPRGTPCLLSPLPGPPSLRCPARAQLGPPPGAARPGRVWREWAPGPPQTLLGGSPARWEGVGREPPNLPAPRGRGLRGSSSRASGRRWESLVPSDQLGRETP